MGGASAHALAQQGPPPTTVTASTPRPNQPTNPTPHTTHRLHSPQALRGVFMASVLWFQGGACSGNTMSFLNAEEPNVVDLIVDFGLDLLWHPSLGLELGNNAQKVFWDCANGERPLDIFVFEGTVIE